MSDQTQELIYKQTIADLKAENKSLKEKIVSFETILKDLQDQVDVKGVDMIQAIKDFQEMSRETRVHLKEIKALKNELILKKAEYEKRMEEAVRNIVGDPF